MSAPRTTTTAAQQEPERERRERALRLPQQRPSGDGGGDSSTGPEGDDSDDDEDCRDGGRSDESTQFGGASAEWSDTASYASDASGCGGDGGCGCGCGCGGGVDAISSSPDANITSSCRCRSGRSSRTGDVDVAKWRRKPKAIAAAHTGPGYNDNAAAAARLRERRRRRRRVGEEGATEGGSRSNEVNGSDAGYAQDVDSTTSPSDSDNDSDNDGSGGSSSDGDADDPLEPIPGEVKLVPSMFPDRSPTVFFEYPKELGMARFNNVYFSEPLGSRRLLFKCHWERNSVKNAFFRAGFSRTRSTMSWTASWGKHPTREGFRCDGRVNGVHLSLWVACLVGRYYP